MSLGVQFAPKKHVRIDVEGFRQPPQSLHTGVPLSALEIADVASIHVGCGRKLVLRKATLAPERSHIPSEELDHVHHQ